MYKLRGHHLFCLLGYRGMDYSKEYVENMTRLHQTLRDNPKTWIQLVKGPDQLCEKYPNTGEYHGRFPRVWVTFNPIFNISKPPCDKKNKQ